MLKNMEQIQERQVIIASPKETQRKRVQRSLALLFDERGEAVQWIEVSTPDEAVAAIDAALLAIKDIEKALEIVVAMAGYGGQWFEISGHVREVGEKAIKVILMSGDPREVKMAAAEGIESVPTILSEMEIARLIARILFGQSSVMTGGGSVADAGEPRYETFEESP
jgi:hypothetical protein